MSLAACSSSYSAFTAGLSKSTSSNLEPNLAGRTAFFLGAAEEPEPPMVPAFRILTSTSMIRMSMSFIVAGATSPAAASSSVTSSSSRPWIEANSFATSGSL